jgi:Mrp family chromosome partitioning ATPase
LNEGGIEVHCRVNVNSLEDVTDAERGLDAARDELKIMLKSANTTQKNIYSQLIREMRTNSVSFVSGAAGTGKSFLLRMYERHYRLKGYKVTEKHYLRNAIKSRSS